MTVLVAAACCVGVFGVVALAAREAWSGLVSADPVEAADESKLSWRSFVCERFGVRRGQVEGDAERN